MSVFYSAQYLLEHCILLKGSRHHEHAVYCCSHYRSVVFLGIKNVHYTVESGCDPPHVMLWASEGNIFDWPVFHLWTFNAMCCAEVWPVANTTGQRRDCCKLYGCMPGCIQAQPAVRFNSSN